MPKQVSDASRRARGLRKISIWLEVEVLDQLDAICDETGWSRAEILRDMITGESEEAAEMRPRQKYRPRLVKS